jgi:hypothetical protein
MRPAAGGARAEWLAALERLLEVHDVISDQP